jgi:streptogramin lyase
VKSPSIVVPALALALTMSATARADLEFEPPWGSPGVANGQFTTASGIASDGTGNVYVTDATANRVQRFAADGTFISVFGAGLSGPGDVAADGLGSVYIVDTGNGRVLKYTREGAPLLPFGSFGDGEGQFREPSGVATDPEGNIYVADARRDRVQRFFPDGTPDPAWRLKGRVSFGSAQDIAVDVFGDVYVLDAAASHVHKFTSDGRPLPGFGTPGVRAGQFDAPLGIGTDGEGNVYVADTGNDRVQVFALDGTFLSQFGGPAAGANSLDRPVDVASDVTGAVYVVDQNNDRVVKLRPTTTPLRPPVAFETANVTPLLGTVLVKRPGSPGFMPLARGQQVPIGSQVRTVGGVARLVSASNLHRRQQNARFYGGQFAIEQPRDEPPVTELRLTGGGFQNCTQPAVGRRAGAAVAHRRAKRRRKLWGDGRGRFRTRGRYGTAGVRGTKWLTEDTCDATSFRLVRGVVEVRDFARRSTVTLSRRGQTYTARRP